LTNRINDVYRCRDTDQREQAMTRSVLISGAGIAGPSLAYWLLRYGYAVTVVEQAPGPRHGGAAVDFRGDQLALLTRMGVLDDIRANQTGMGEQVVVDATGRRQATFPAFLFSGDVEIDRGDLARILYKHSTGAEYVFGDRVTALTQRADAVEVEFAHGGRREFDLVVGADGLHSGVRRLAFGPAERFRTDLGYHTAAFTVPNTFGIDHSGLIYNEPNRYVSVSSARNQADAIVSLLFHAEDLHYDRHDPAALRRVVTEHFAGVGWRTPELLAALPAATDLYVDSLSQIRLDAWSVGRVVLLGDAAWCAGPGGNGTGHAMLGAYVLAGELAAAGGDHRVAFARYERELRPAIEKSQKFAAGAGRYLAPPTERKIRRRDRTYRFLNSRPLSGLLRRLASRNADTGALTDYPDPEAGFRVGSGDSPDPLARR
jgi:2-polyprenyl-6-methoxyphenol hydroxylase-like FAD-dependent oxidoreductase